ncbi:MAG: hypothetical protein K9M10_02580 [Candidatus Pacebacteria bacterium]|nr:hypothetical protein [Candidatus Paceibacterota bacterium]MCF7857342.1 hypothetical protein [Candidatus Paceibacterota bacterium]
MVVRHHEYMRERFNNYTLTRPRLRKIAGWFLVVFGFLMLVTPLTPGGTLFFVGLEILGLRIVFTNKFKRLFSRKNSLPPQPETLLVE